jgi:serine/threonine-protein kinase HipA
MLTDTALRNLKPKSKIYKASDRDGMYVTVSPKRYPAFHETGKRMLREWNAGMNSLSLQRTWSLPSLKDAIERAGFSAVKPAAPAPMEKIGRSPLLGRR